MDCMDRSRDRYKDYSRVEEVVEQQNQRGYYIQVELMALPQGMVVVVLVYQPVSEKIFSPSNL